MKAQMHPKYQAFEVTCDSCGEQRWPYLPERPLSYTCVRCRSLPPGEVERRREHGKRATEHLAVWRATKEKRKKCPKSCRCLCHDT